MAQPNSLQLGDDPSANSDIDIDRLSQLPMGIHDIILGKLPICDAARTSVLSRAWRDKWLGQSTFAVDIHGILDSRETERQTKDHALMRIVSYFLLNHQANIRRVTIRTYCDRNMPMVYGWLHKLSSSKVEEFALDELDSRSFRLPSYLFVFKQLRSLQLCRCKVELPPNFGGFIFLIELSLKIFSMKHKDVIRLIVLCQAIERLTILYLDDAGELTITAPALKYLCIDSGFQSVILKYAPKLSAVDLVRSVDNQELTVHKLIHGISNLPSLEQLHLDGYAELWAKPGLLDRFPLRNEHLSTLILDDMTFDKLDVLMVCFSLLQSCPGIHTFNFSVKGRCSKAAASFFLEDPEHIHFPHLRNVTFKYFHQMGAAFDFLCFLVRQSPILERATLVKDGYCQITKGTVERILRRVKQRAPNTNAELKFLSKVEPIDALPCNRKRGRDDVVSHDNVASESNQMDMID